MVTKELDRVPSHVYHEVNGTDAPPPIVRGLDVL